MDSRIETYKHIQLVQRYLNNIVVQLLARSLEHDQSKLYSPEVEIFDEMTEKLANSTYMSEEYKGFLKELKPALDHHYKNNRHHPEFHNLLLNDEEINTLKNDIQLLEKYRNVNYVFSEDEKIYESLFQRIFNVLKKVLAEKQSRINNMSLVDLIEMICDFKAASLRHIDGNIYKSININENRFNYSGQLSNIFTNTIKEMENGKVIDE